jgi:ribosomal 50S subunit-associated protein YjgA (DUF615 family)
MSGYNHLCFCNECSAETLIRLGLPALTQQEFIARAKRHKMSDAQQRRVDAVKKMMMMMRNDEMKGCNE